MAAVQNPVVLPTETSVVEPTLAPVAPLTADKPTETVNPVVEPTVEEPAKTEAETVAPVEEKKEEKKEEKPVEPIYSGALGYKAPGLKNIFKFSKKYFWFGEEPVPAASLSQFLRGEKDAEYAHTVAAWSSVTGKGLLFFVKHADQKETPAGVLKLADATDLSKDGTVAFFFKIHGHKHTFEAQTAPERNGWFVAVEKAIAEAKTESEAIIANETYTEQLAKLGKPTTLAGSAAKESSAPKKSIDATPKLAETEAPVVPVTEAAAPVPARTGSSSSSSSDEEKRRKKAAKSKSRSVSRGKRASIFGGLLGKKEKAEEKKEDEVVAKKEEETTVAPVAEPSTATAPIIATVVTDDLPKPIEEAKPVEEAKPIEEAKPTEETATPVIAPIVEEKPKPTKRGSIFGNFVEKLKSPTTEKKEAELIPAPISKDSEVSAEAPKIEEPIAPIVPVTDGTTETPKVEETKPVNATTPHKEKSSFSFGKFLGGSKEKVKSPTTEKAPSSEAPQLEDPVKADEAPVLAPIEPVAAPVEPVAEAPKEEEPVGVTSTATATPPTATQKKRGSIFGNLTGGSVKKEKDGETSEKPKGLSGLFRSASKATKAKKEEKTTTPPAKVDEATEPKDDAPLTEAKLETPVAATEPQSIGDVVPDAVAVGQAPKSTTQVATSA